MANIDGIPIAVRAPSDGTANRPVALWLPWLAGTKEAVLPTLDRLAERGYVAISFDPYLHGTRSIEVKEQMVARVFSRFRHHMWSLLGHSVLDALRVLDRAVHELGTSPHFVAGGISIGGDIALALAGIEPRVKRVATIASSPDWTRPGMIHLDETKGLVDQGEPDAQSKWLYSQLDPFLNLERFVQGPAISFDCGDGDRHVPCEAAQRFKDALVARNRGRDETIQLTVRRGLDHVGASSNDELVSHAIDFLTNRRAGPSGL